MHMDHMEGVVTSLMGPLIRAQLDLRPLRSFGHLRSFLLFPSCYLLCKHKGIRPPAPLPNGDGHTALGIDLNAVHLRVAAAHFGHINLTEVPPRTCEGSRDQDIWAGRVWWLGF